MTRRIASKCICGAEFLATDDGILPAAIQRLWREWQALHRACTISYVDQQQQKLLQGRAVK